MNSQSRGGDSANREALLGRTVGRYRIDASVGIGGMGEVFRAWDSRLDKTVAVKALRPELAGDARSRQRFVRESRYASRVQHPFVCSVLDVVEDREDLFLVMEYVEGRRLDDVVRDDRPSVERVRDLAIEIAEALGAIHGTGLVHRDLKPSNVMVTGDGHVKVMDFGVARVTGHRRSPDGSDSTMTEEGFGVGTIAYMSPEQIRGQKADARSDLFSLGIVLYQAITGEHPFERGSPYATASAILNDPPGGGHEPQTLSTAGATRQVVMRLLEKDPALRYPSAEVLLEDLKAIREGRVISAKPKPAARYGRATVVTAAVLVLAAAVTGYSWWSGRKPPVAAAAARPTVVVLPFDESATDPEADLRGWMIADLIAADLDASGRVRRIPLERVADILRALPSEVSAAERGERIAAATGARWIVSGRLYRPDDGYEVALDIRDTSASDLDGQALRLRGTTSTALADVAGGRLLASFGFGSKGRTGVFDPAFVGSSPSDRARTLEQRARRALREERIREAVALFRAAIAQDGPFLLARSGLSEALLRGGWETDARRVAGEASEMAVARGGRLSETVAARVQAVRDRVVDDREAEIRTLSRLVDRNPDDTDGWFDLGNAYFGTGRNEEAKTALERALAIEPVYFGASLRRALVLAKLGHSELADQSVGTVAPTIAELAGDSGRGRIASTRAELARLGRRYAESAAGYEEAMRRYLAAGAPGAASIARGNLGNALVLAGRYDDAIGVLREASTESRAIGQPKQTVQNLWQLGNALLQTGRGTEAEAYLRDAIVEVSALGNARLEAYVKAALAGHLMFTLKPAEAESLAQDVLAKSRALRIPTLEANATDFLANIAFQKGDIAAARSGYRALLARQGEPAFKAQVEHSWLGLTEVEEAVGATGEALKAAEEALRLQREAGQDVERAYTMTFLARIRAQTADRAASTAAADEADAVAAKLEPSERRTLAARIVFARAYLDWALGKPDDALRKLDTTKLDPTEDPAYASIAGALRAEALLAASRPVEALRAADAVLESPASLATSRMSCRAVAAEAALRTGDRSRASTESRRGLEDALRMSMPLEAARCATVALEANRTPPDGAALARTAREQLDAYANAAPESRRSAIRSRPQFAETELRLSRAVTRP